MPLMNCLLCDTSCIGEVRPQDSVLEINCGVCGTYRTLTASRRDIEALSRNDRSKLSAVCQEFNLRKMKKDPQTTFFLTTLPIVQYAAPRGEAVIPVSEALDSFPKTVDERMDRALVNLALLSDIPGEWTNVASDHYRPVFYAENEIVFRFIREQMIKMGWIERSEKGISADCVIRVSAEGWRQYNELKDGRKAANPSQVFVAMSFSPEHKYIWEEGIEPGIALAGYRPFRIDLKEHNGKIDDEIMAEIRKSRFLVADFTAHKAGAYFESGFALGLGLPVIWTCQKSDLAKTHFDTNHYNHIDWETPEELKKRLSYRILATIGQGPIR